MKIKKPQDSTDLKPQLYVTALARGLDILRCFSAGRQELGTTEIAKLVGLPQPTVWRLCNTLLHLGYLIPGNTQNRLRVGAAVLLLGHTAITHTGISEFAQPLMKQLADTFGISVSLAERDRTRMMITQRAEAEGIVKVNLYIGSTLDMTDSSLGLAYLCGLDEITRNELLEQIRLEGAELWNQSNRNIKEALNDYQEKGMVFNLGRSHPDINAIGIPVISPTGKKVMALTCGGAKSSLSKEYLADTIAPLLKGLAKKIAPLVE